MHQEDIEAFAQKNNYSNIRKLGKGTFGLVVLGRRDEVDRVLKAQKASKEFSLEVLHANICSEILCDHVLHVCLQCLHVVFSYLYV